jgi:hypothetical protein
MIKRRIFRFLDVLQYDDGWRGAFAVLCFFVGLFVAAMAVMFGVGYAVQVTYYAIGEHVWPFIVFGALSLIGLLAILTAPEKDPS